MTLPCALKPPELVLIARVDTQLPRTRLPTPRGVPLGYHDSTSLRSVELTIRLCSTRLSFELVEPSPEKMIPSPLSAITLPVITAPVEFG